MNIGNLTFTFHIQLVLFLFFLTGYIYEQHSELLTIIKKEFFFKRSILIPNLPTLCDWDIMYDVAPVSLVTVNTGNVPNGVCSFNCGQSSKEILSSSNGLPATVNRRRDTLFKVNNYLIWHIHFLIDLNFQYYLCSPW